MGVTISITLTQNSQSVTNNTSSVTAKVIATYTDGSWNASGNSGTLTFNGSDYTFWGYFNAGRKTSGSETMFEKTISVPHNSDGTKTVSASVKYVTNTWGTLTASKSLTLTTIPRKSTLTASNGTLGTAQTLTVTRKSTSFTHTITYACGDASGTVCTKSSDTSISWTPPLSLASQNTTGTSVSVKFTITTYNGTASVGSNTKSITCAIPSSVKPSCSISVTDANGYADTYGGFLKGLSKFKVVVTPTISYGSPISSYSTSANGSKYSSASFTTGVITSSGTLTISTTVKDKRGRSGTASVSKTVLNYSQPSISKLTVKRCNSDGTENLQGEYIKVEFSATVTSLSNKNTASYTLKYKKTSSSTYTTVTLSSYANVYSVSNGSYTFAADSGSSYDVVLEIVDKFNASNPTSHATTVSTAFAIMHWKADGTAMAIGKISEQSNLFDVGMPIRFYGGITHPVLEPGTDLNSVLTPNTYIGANVSTYNYGNCPLTSGTFTLEVVGMGEEGQVKQRLTYCHKTAARAMERIYYSSSWGNWICVSDFDGQILWSGAYYMTAGHTVTLSEPVSRQKNGIILVFSRYSGGEAKNYHFAHFFVSKAFVAAHPGVGSTFIMSTADVFDVMASKYVYINDGTIAGNAINNEAGTGDSGIKYDNAGFVMRYVIGV